MYYLYILYSSDSDIYYVGYTQEINQRLHSHNETSLDSFTSKHRPWKLMSLFQISEIEADAIRIERFIKKQKSRRLLEKLIRDDFEPDGILAKLVKVPHVRD